MMVPNRSANLAAYQMVATHGGVAAADPHGLIVMLMDGALNHIAQARASLDHQTKAQRFVHLNKALVLVSELRASLDLSQGEIAGNLDGLYDYMIRQLLKAHIDEGSKPLDEVAKLLQEIRGAWIALPAAARALRPEAT
jgi:flagellar protein FliS